MISMTSTTLLFRLVLGALLCVSAASVWTQAVHPDDSAAAKTRAQVRQEFLEWRAAGYDPADWLDYPDNALRTSRAN